MSIEDSKVREWYEKETIESSWSVRTLQRNINTQYYYRIIASQVKEPVIKEMEDKTLEHQLDKLEHIKNPVVLEFLGIQANEDNLKAEIEHQKEVFYLSQAKKNNKDKW